MPTITMTQFTHELAEKLNVTPAEAKRWLDAQEQLEDMHLSQGDTIRNTGRWTLELAHRPPRQTVIGFGEQKGQKKKTPERYMPHFSASPKWRDEMTAARKRADRRMKAAERRKPAEAPQTKPQDEAAQQMATLSAQLAEVNARIAERATAGKQPLKRDMERLSSLQTQLQALTPTAPTRQGRGRKSQAQAA